LEVPGFFGSRGTSTFNLHPTVPITKLIPSHYSSILTKKINREYAKEKKNYVSTPPMSFHTAITSL
jgi:hypothetical protein